MRHQTISRPIECGIERRTVLGLLCGSLAGLAGCSGGESGDSGDSGSIDGLPEERSKYIAETAIEVVDNGRELALEVAVTDEIDPFSVSVITEDGRQFSSELFNSGETWMRLSLTWGEDTHEPHRRGQHKIHLRGDDVETEVPLVLGITFELEEVVPGTERQKIRDDSLGVVVRNVGQRTGAATRAIVNGANEDGEPFAPVKPGETGIVEFTFHLADGASCVKVEETTEREEELTVEFLWSESVTFTQSIRYDTSQGCDRSLVGDPEEITATSTEMET